MNSGTPSILTALLSGLVSGIVVALLNYFLTRKKTEAEIRKLEAETEKIRIEINNNVESLSATVNYRLANSEERIIYDSSKGNGGYDFKMQESRVYRDDKAVGEKAAGAFTIKDGILNIQRQNTDGRIEIWLQQYFYDGEEKANIPKNALIVGQRKMRISCQARIVGGEHSLRFVLKNMEKGNWLADEKRKISSDDWTMIDIYFQIPPTVDCVFRIDDEDVTQAPSSIHIRNLVLAEKMPTGR
jgi:hypothetical protein